MKEVSAEFITAITKKRFRKPRGRVIIHYMRSSKYDVSVQHSINNQARHSRNSQCADQYKDATYKYLSLDNKALMDGTYHPFPGTENHVWQAGLWGSILAGESGTFVSNPLITVLFSDRLIRNYHVAFDSKREEYAVNFTVKIYNSDDELIYTDIVENNDSVYYEKILPMNVVINDGKYMTLEIVEWSEPGACVKIVEFFLTYSETYDDDMIILISSIHEREFKTGTLPVGNISSSEVSIKLSNKDNRFSFGNTDSPFNTLIRPDLMVEVFLGVEKANGTEEFVKIGTYYTSSWSSPEGEITTNITAHDYISRLIRSDYQYNVVHTNISASNMIKNFFESMDVPRDKYVIDAAFDDLIIPIGYLNKMSGLEAFKKIVQAVGGQAFVDDNGIIQITPASFLESAAVQTIGKDFYFTKDTPLDIGNLANIVQITNFPLRIQESPQQLFLSQEEIILAPGETITNTIFYNDHPCVDVQIAIKNNPAGIDIIYSKIYAWGASVTVKNNTIGYSEFKIVAEGFPVLPSQNVEIFEARNQSSINTNGEFFYTYKNELLQDSALSQDIANNLITSFSSLRQYTDLSWPGNPALQLGDKISVEDYLGTFLDVFIVKQEFEYDGSLTSKITGRSI